MDEKAFRKWQLMVNARLLDMERSIDMLFHGERTTERNLTAEMVVRYGEMMNKTEAARLLGVTRATVYAMLADGRIKGTSNGKNVLTRSVVEYLCGPNGRKTRKKVKDDGADALEEAEQS